MLWWGLQRRWGFLREAILEVQRIDGFYGFFKATMSYYQEYKANLVRKTAEESHSFQANLVQESSVVIEM